MIPRGGNHKEYGCSGNNRDGDDGTGAAEAFAGGGVNIGDVGVGGSVADASAALVDAVGGVYGLARAGTAQNAVNGGLVEGEVGPSAAVHAELGVGPVV